MGDLRGCNLFAVGHVYDGCRERAVVDNQVQGFDKVFDVYEVARFVACSPKLDAVAGIQFVEQVPEELFFQSRAIGRENAHAATLHAPEFIVFFAYLLGHHFVKAIRRNGACLGAYGNGQDVGIAVHCGTGQIQEPAAAVVGPYRFEDIDNVGGVKIEVDQRVGQRIGDTGRTRAVDADVESILLENAVVVAYGRVDDEIPWCIVVENYIALPNFVLSCEVLHAMAADKPFGTDD